MRLRYTVNVHVSSLQLTVQCRPKRKAPCGMGRGSATADHQFAYFMPSGSGKVYRYSWNYELWTELSQCRYSNSALAIIEGELTAVGGERGSNHTNKLLTLRRTQWVEVYPPMKNVRSQHAAVSTPDGGHIIVIGRGALANVELLQVRTRQWYELTSLPQPLSVPSATICGNKVHVISSISGDGYSCFLQALPSSDKPITPQSMFDRISWTPLPQPPLRTSHSTAATLCGQLVVIGGWLGKTPFNSIYQLMEGRWVEIGSMISKRSHCLIASQSPNKILIVGGYKDMPFLSQLLDGVEECTVV